MSRRHRALVVEPDQDAFKAVKSVLEAHGHECVRLTSLDDAEDALRLQPFCHAIVACAIAPRARAARTVAASLKLVHRIRRAYPPQAFLVVGVGGLEQIGRHCGRFIRAGCSDLLATRLDPTLLEQRVQEAALVCEARRARCPTVPAPPTLRDTYRVDRSVHFVGTCERRRYLLKVEDEEVRLPRRLFEGLLLLTVHLFKSPEDHVPRTRVFGDHPNPAVSKLRRLLLDVGLAEAIAQDNHGGIRLSVRPDRVTFDTEQLRKEFPLLVDRLAPEDTSR